MKHLYFTVIFVKSMDDDNEFPNSDNFADTEVDFEAYQDKFLSLTALKPLA